MKNRGLIVIGVIVVALVVWMMMGSDATSPTDSNDGSAEVSETPEITEENAADIAAELEGLDIADIEAEFEAIDEDYENL